MTTEWATVPGRDGVRVPSCHVEDRDGDRWYQVAPNEFNPDQAASWGIGWQTLEEHYGMGTISFNGECRG